MDALGWQEQVPQLSPYQGSTLPSDAVTHPSLTQLELPFHLTQSDPSFLSQDQSSHDWSHFQLCGCGERDVQSFKRVKWLLAQNSKVDLDRKQVHFLFASTLIAGEKHRK